MSTRTLKKDSEEAKRYLELQARNEQKPPPRKKSAPAPQPKE